MNLTKSIIDEMVTYIDFADIREFVKNNPVLVQLEKITKKNIFTSFILVENISEIKKFNLCNFKKKIPIKFLQDTK